MGEGARLVTRSGETLAGIVASVKKVADLVGEITVASQEQSQGIDQVNKAVIRTDQVTQTTAAEGQRLSSAARKLAGQADELRNRLAQFNLAACGGSTEREDEAPGPPASPNVVPIAIKARASDRVATLKPTLKPATGGPGNSHAAAQAPGPRMVLRKATGTNGLHGHFEEF